MDYSKANFLLLVLAFVVVLLISSKVSADEFIEATQIAQTGRREEANRRQRHGRGINGVLDHRGGIPGWGRPLLPIHRHGQRRNHMPGHDHGVGYGDTSRSDNPDEANYGDRFGARGQGHGHGSSTGDRGMTVPGRSGHDMPTRSGRGYGGAETKH